MGIKRVTVLLSDEEYAQVKNKAGLIPLSRWFKNLAINDGAEPRRAEKLVAKASANKQPLAESAEMPTAPNLLESGDRSTQVECANVNCGHVRSKHGGFNGACQADGCLCGGFE